MGVKLAILLATALSFAGCANFSPLTSAKPLIKNGNYWLTYDSTRRGAYVFVDDNGKTRICAEPAPDAVYSFINKLEASVKANGTEAGGKGELTANALALAGRDRTVLVAREMLYRICEMNANGTLPNDKVYSAFKEVSYLLKSLAEVERLRAATELTKNLSVEATEKVLTPPK